VLDGEHVREAALVRPRPDVVAVGRAHQLRRDADLASSLAYAALEDIGHAKRRANFCYVLRLALEGEGRRPRRDAQAGNVREGVQDLLRESIREVLVCGVVAHVDEGKDGDGRPRCAAWGRGDHTALPGPARHEGVEDSRGGEQQPEGSEHEGAVGAGARFWISACGRRRAFDAARTDVVGPGEQKRDGQAEAEADHHHFEQPFWKREPVHYRLDYLENGEGSDSVGHQYAE